MRIGSLCTGIGMLDYAVAKAFDAVTLWGVDSDPIAARLASHRLGAIVADVPLGEQDWDSVPPVDIMTAGWPCQPWSQAGKGLGTDDHRAIWPEIGRALRVLRPKYVVLENVPGIFTAGELNRVGDTLAALGYEFRWTTLRASECGAPHRRDRVFILGCHEGFPRHDGLTAPLIPPVRPINYLLPTPCASDGERTGSLVTGDHNPRLADVVHDPEYMMRVTPALKRWTNISRRKPPAMFVDTKVGTRRLNPAYVEWMMGHPKGWTSEIDVDLPGEWHLGRPKSALPVETALRLIGNSVVPQQVTMALGRLFNYREEVRLYGID